MEGLAGPGDRANGPVAPPSSPVGSPIDHPLSAAELEEEQQSSLTDVTQLWIKFAKTFAIIFPIYILGYFEFSFSWVLIGLAVLFYWRKNHGSKDYRINRALAFLEHDEKAVRRSVPTTELPPWVHYPDVERVEWLNKTVKQMWPFICQFVDKLFRETIEPAVKGANPHLSSFCFTKIDMGNKPLRVNGVKVYTENVDKRQVIMDLQIRYQNPDFCDVISRVCLCFPLQLHGVMRVVMEPLLGDMPLIGALSVFFLKKPLLDINWTGLTNMLDIPGVNGLCDNIIQDIIYSFLVLPNSPLVSPHLSVSHPCPQGVLRIHLIEAQDLLGKDKFLGGLIKGKSDPYGVVQVGIQQFQSKVIHETVNPKWNEVYEASGVITGIIKINYGWFALDDVASGKLHLKLEWLSLLPTPEKLEKALMTIKADRGHANDGLSSALLVVFLDSARNLPVSQSGHKNVLSGKKVTSDPSPFVQFTVGHKSFESKTRFKTNEPVWEEAFTFLIHNPNTQELEVEVKDAKHECSLGTLTLPLSRLLEAEDMTLNQRFPLKNSGPSCTVKMKMALRVGGEELFIHWRWSKVLLHSFDLLLRETVCFPLNGNHKLFFSPSCSIVCHPFRCCVWIRTLPHHPAPPHPQCRSASLTPPTRPRGRLCPQTPRSLPRPPPLTSPSLLFSLCSGSGPSYFPLGEVQLTVRHSSQRNKLIVVVHGCRNLIAFTDHGSDPYVRLYLLPDKRRSGRRKTHTFKKTLNPVYDQTFEFSVSLVELHRRTLDVAVKNGGGLLSKHKGLLGKVLVDLTHEDITKGWTQWYELSEDGLTKPHQL
uniref:Extended synaptotagmin-2-like n=1 Tax=Echeneis naucrates TaxID=173247 RepID=A0A665XFE4_ECHNA